MTPSYRSLRARFRLLFSGEGVVCISSTISFASDSRIYNFQKALKELNFDSGSLDGKLGYRTKEAIKRFQQRHNLPITGNVDRGLEDKLLISQAETIDNNGNPNPDDRHPHLFGIKRFPLNLFGIKRFPLKCVWYLLAVVVSYVGRNVKKSFPASLIFAFAMLVVILLPEWRLIFHWGFMLVGYAIFSIRMNQIITELVAKNFISRFLVRIFVSVGLYLLFISLVFGSSIIESDGIKDIFLLFLLVKITGLVVAFFFRAVEEDPSPLPSPAPYQQRDSRSYPRKSSHAANDYNPITNTDFTIV